MPDLVIRYVWESKPNYERSCIVIVNMTKKLFYAYKPSMVVNEKTMRVYNNNDSLNYWVDLKDKASYEDLVKCLEKADFERI